ncbi:MAG TPA: dihydrofolate reductase family protein [Gemmatimonadales bacterium]|nr:dihydrofolate reductase family protein [Gemmatimonadales bacterium]
MNAAVFVGTSLDGFIARRDGKLDFLPAGGGEDHGYSEFFAGVDTLVIGRKTYETVLEFPEWPYGSKPIVVLSSREIERPRDSRAIVERMAGHPREIVARLEARGARDLYVDGGVTIQRFLEAGLIQRLVVTRVPVLIGSGIPLFGPLSRDIRLRHIETRQYPSGLVTSEYTIISDREEAP